MAYLINNTRLARVTINGVDITDRVTDISLSDSSGIKNGLIATDGEMTLAYRPGSPDREDYARSTFKRGSYVIIDVTYPSGNTRRHPRGFLRVIDTIFDPQNESIKVNLGCSMAFHALTENVDELIPLCTLYVPETRKNYSSISACLAAEGKIAWYDRHNVLQCEKYWDGETDTSSPPGQWVSVFGLTTQAIASLDSTRSIEASEKAEGSPYQGSDPDNIELSYDKVEDGKVIDPETGELIPDPDRPGGGDGGGDGGTGGGGDGGSSGGGGGDGGSGGDGGGDGSGDGGGDGSGGGDGDGDGDDNEPDIPPRADVSESFGSYFVQYPAVYYERVPPQEQDDGDPGGGGGDDEDGDALGNAGVPDEDNGLDEPRPSDCIAADIGDGNAPPENNNPASTSPEKSGGDGNGDTDCMDGYQTARRPLYVAVKSKGYAITTFEGPAGARDRVIDVQYGPALEINGQYFGDLFQICRQSWATRCNPNGYCGTSEGTKMVKLSESETRITYNADGSVRSEYTERYEPLLAAATADNWRSGVVDGNIVGFRRIDYAITAMYRASVTITEYAYGDAQYTSMTTRTTTSYESITKRGGGMPSTAAEADALKGIKTVRVEKSTSYGLNPDLLTTEIPEPPTETEFDDIVFPDYEELPPISSGPEVPPPLDPETGEPLPPEEWPPDYTPFPDGGPGSDGGYPIEIPENPDPNDNYPTGDIGFTFKETMPYPIFRVAGDPKSVEEYVADYSDYLVRMIKGQSLGLRLGEAMREEIADSWVPNLSFRYADPRYNTIISMRGDAHTWSLTPDQCVFAVDGLNVGFSNGTLFVPDNVEGVTTAVL